MTIQQIEYSYTYEIVQVLWHQGLMPYGREHRNDINHLHLYETDGPTKNNFEQRSVEGI